MKVSRNEMESILLNFNQSSKAKTLNQSERKILNTMISAWKKNEGVVDLNDDVLKGLKEKLKNTKRTSSSSSTLGKISKGIKNIFGFRVKSDDLLMKKQSYEKELKSKIEEKFVGMTHHPFQERLKNQWKDLKILSAPESHNSIGQDLIRHLDDGQVRLGTKIDSKMNQSLYTLSPEVRVQGFKDRFHSLLNEFGSKVGNKEALEQLFHKHFDALDAIGKAEDEAIKPFMNELLQGDAKLQAVARLIFLVRQTDYVNITQSALGAVKFSLQGGYPDLQIKENKDLKKLEITFDDKTQAFVGKWTSESQGEGDYKKLHIKQEIVVKVPLEVSKEPTLEIKYVMLPKEAFPALFQQMKALFGHLKIPLE